MGGEKVFEDVAREFGVEGDFLFDGGVFRDGEFVAIKGTDKAADFRPFESGLAIGCAQVHLTLFAEEKKVGHGERIVVAVGKSVNAYILRFFFRADGLVETFKQTAVPKENRAK